MSYTEMWRQIKQEARDQELQEIADKAFEPKEDATVTDGGVTYKNFEEWAKRNNVGQKMIDAMKQGTLDAPTFSVSDSHHDSTTCERCQDLIAEQKALGITTTFGQKVWEYFSNMEAPPLVKWLTKEEWIAQTRGWTDGRTK